MTCIVGWVENGTVTMGGDSAGVGGYYSVPRADEKVFRNGPFVMGFTTSFRMGQLLRHALTPPTPREGADLSRFMVCDFVDAVRQCLKDGGYAKKENEVEQAGSFLVGFRGRLFDVDSDYQVGEARVPYGAVGCGRDFALGALHALRDRQMSARARVRAALEAAVHWSAGVRPPFTIKQLRGGH